MKKNPASFATRVAIRSLTALLPAALVTGLLLWEYHKKELKEDRRVILLSEQIQLDRLQAAIKKDLKPVLTDVDYLQRLLQQKLLKEEVPLGNLLDEFRSNALLFSKAKLFYDQLRILDEHGMELLRINQKNNQPVLIPDDLLQNKSDRYYYAEYMRLSPDEIYASPFDLNVEHGEIEQPENPMLRFAKTVYDKEGNPKGAVLLNYKGSSLLDELNQRLAGQTMLVNRDGFYLYHTDQSKMWGFMYPDRHNQNLQTDRPFLWNQVSTHQKGCLFDNDGLAVYETIDLMEETANHNIKWKLVRHLSPADLRAAGHDDHIPHWVEFLILTVLFGGISTLVASNITHKQDVLHETELSNLRYRQLAEKLEESNSIKELLLDILSHDLRNPAGAISQLGELLHEELGENEMVDMIQQSSSSLDKVIQTAGTLSKISMGEEIDKQELDLVAMIRETVDEFQLHLNSIGMQVKMELPPTLIIRANSILTEVFKNFITNAMRYADKGKSLEISITQTEQSIRVDFADQGETIPENQREMVFERRKQLGKVPGKGSGLGLAIVRRIAAIHKAEVGIRPNTPTGNIFYIDLPR